ncbi:MAG: IS110 family transposase, partial [Acutalibacteraceae bacterium]|nr:IS110 family transposase [Acutalibacteraceae bacterium]
MYFVGIDISKFKHDCFIVDNNGEVIVSSWSFANDQEGFLLFKDFLDGLEGEIRIGFESTGHYTDNIRLFLERHHFSFMELNPLLISRFNNSKSLRKTKSDTIDAALIAQYLMTVEYKPNPPTLYHIEALKSLTRFRDKLVKLRSRQLVELTNILDKVFPEFKPFFSNRFSATAIYIIANYQTPESIANMNSRSFEL